MKTRPTIAGDIPALQTVLDETKLFPAELLPEMVQGFISEDPIAAEWLTCERQGEAIGFCFAEPEPHTAGCWNMRAIAVSTRHQGNGAGRALVAALENRLSEAGQRILIVDTSGTDAFALTRRFYARQGYREIARIPDFWGPDDDKIMFWKRLRA